MRKVAVVSYRLGGLDGVSVEAAKWIDAFARLGIACYTVAATGADRTVAGLGTTHTGPVDAAGLADALADADLVVADNICSLPLNPAASEAVAAALRGRPAVLRHHDLPWQRPGMDRPVPDDRSWVHVTVTEFNRRQLAARGIDAVVMRNRFDSDPPPGRREETRTMVGAEAGRPLVLQPTRAIPRKAVGAGLQLAHRLGAVFWLTGPAEDGYGPELDALLAGARVPVVRGAVDSVADAYAAADVVALPSSWEGFGNPAVEAAAHRRPAYVGPYPAADELAELGFRWFRPGDEAALSSFVRRPDRELLDANADAVRAHLDLARLPEELERLLGLVPGAG